MEQQEKNLVKFGTYTVEAAEEEAKRVGATEFLKIEPGKTRVRVLPPVQGESSPFKMVKQHAITRIGDKYPFRFACIGTACPACAHGLKLEHTGNPRDREQASSFNPRLKVFTLAVNRKEEGRGPLVWEFGKTVYEKLTKLRLNEDAGGDFCHPYKGFDVIVERTGTGKNDTRYEVFPARESSALCDDPVVLADWCNNRPSLERFTRLMTPAEVEAELSAIGSDDDAYSRGPVKRLERNEGPRRRTIEDDLA